MVGRRTLGAVGLAMAIALVMAVVFAPAASAVSPDPNPWLQKRFIVMAHQGGEDEAPSNTMFALKSAIQDRGADSLELDVNLSSDGQLMVIHDDTWTRIACTHTLCPGPDSSTEEQRPDNQVRNMTAAQLQQLDAGYWFRPGSYSHNYDVPATDYPYRGMRFGNPQPPAGYTQEDFEIPTLKQVLDTFPDIPINIEIKMIKTTTGTAGGCTNTVPAYCDDPTASVPAADALANLLNQEPYASRSDLIVVSFSDALLSWFHEMDGPPYVALAPGVNDTTAFALQDVVPDPDVAAFQVPPDQSGIHVPEFLLTTKRAHCLGYAVHIWTNGDQDETPTAYRRFYDSGADGVMTSRPEAFSTWMAENNIPRPDPRDPSVWPIQCNAPPTGAPVPSPQPTPPLKKKKCKKKSKKKHRSASAAKKQKCKKKKKKR
jgi:glycerophosphoryl diester phosphodiesterase